MLLLSALNAERVFDKVWRKIRIRCVHPGLDMHLIGLAGLPTKAIHDLKRNWYDILSAIR
jgi:hypothetical protein